MFVSKRSLWVFCKLYLIYHSPISNITVVYGSWLEHFPTVWSKATSTSSAWSPSTRPARASRPTRARTSLPSRASWRPRSTGATCVTSPYRLAPRSSWKPPSLASQHQLLNGGRLCYRNIRYHATGTIKVINAPLCYIVYRYLSSIAPNDIYFGWQCGYGWKNNNLFSLEVITLAVLILYIVVYYIHFKISRKRIVSQKKI